jgi:hypothetical protein
MTDTHFSGQESENTMSNRARFVGLAVLGAFFIGQLAPVADAQCPTWVTEPTVGVLGFDNRVNDQIVWDPDGAGPQSPVLVVAGDFTVAGTVFANRIAAWNGTTWAPLDGGLTGGNGNVNALAVYNGDLIAAGTFDTADGSPVGHIARWDGTAWQPLGAGTNNFINVLAVYNGDLYAGGQFSQAGGVPAARIARWDGTAWSGVVDPDGDNGLSGNALALGTYAGKLIVGGSFNNAGNTAGTRRVAAWNGTDWEALGEGVDNQVRSIGEYNGELIIGGRFVNATNPGGGAITVNRIASWNGTAWSALSTGISATLGTASLDDLAVYNGELVAAGNFQSAGTLVGTALDLARWNGTAWNTLSTGLNGSAETVAVFNGSLYVGGNIFEAGGVGVGNFARWDGTAWNTVGTSGFNKSITALGEFNGELIAGGAFARNGITQVKNVARYSGGTWQPLGTGLNNAPFAFTTFGSSLIAGGFFTSAGGTPVSNIAAWNGSAWTDLGGGMNSFVKALGTYAGELIAGGNFTTAGGAPIAGIARWNGTTWQPLGGGLDNFDTVESLAVYGGVLVAGGGFGVVDGGLVPANAIATWNGTAWQPLGTGITYFDGVEEIPGAVTALKVFGGDLIAAGAFNIAGGTPVRNVARWNGTAWSAMGGGLGDPLDDPGVSYYVSALEVYNGELYATGTLRVAGTTDDVVIARWDASMNEWVRATTSAADGVAVALFAHAGELHMGGTFSSVDSAVSVFWARLASSPVVVAAPADTSVSALSTLNLSVQANGAPTLTYQWQRNSVALTNGATPSGSVISGATSAALSIANVQLADAGTYTVVISNTCGTVTSVGAAVTVIAATPRCNPADIANDDGSPLPPIGVSGGTNNGVTEGDYNLFFATFFDAGPACDIANDDGSPLPPFGTLQTNNGVTEGDYNLFFAIFFEGCAF